jgi:hypothetical protein
MDDAMLKLQTRNIHLESGRGALEGGGESTRISNLQELQSKKLAANL